MLALISPVIAIYVPNRLVIPVINVVAVHFIIFAMLFTRALSMILSAIIRAKYAFIRGTISFWAILIIISMDTHTAAYFADALTTAPVAAAAVKTAGIAAFE